LTLSKWPALRARGRHHGEGEFGEALGFAGQHFVEAKLAGHAEHGGDVAVRQV
jgi:hypothetical protein